jgi:protoporphyrin/coproporphyrin ferrochelatase
VTTGVVLMTYGAPSGDDDLPRYLAAVRGGRAPSEELVREMSRRYALIGGSPLIRLTQAQAAALERELGAGHVVAAGMRFSAPTIAEAVARLVARGARQVVGICMSPQWSPLLMGGYVRELEAAARDNGVRSAIATAWHRDDLFIDAIVQNLREALVLAPGAFVVMTAHSLPKRVFEAEPEYISQLRATGDLVAARAELAAARWRWAYQSAGHTQEEWLRPDLVELLPEIRASGATDVLVVPVQFLSDHLEVLYDLDIAAAEQARAAGLRYLRITMPNTQPRFIRALANVARSTVGVLLDAVG